MYVYFFIANKEMVVLVNTFKKASQASATHAR